MEQLINELKVRIVEILDLAGASPATMDADGPLVGGTLGLIFFAGGAMNQARPIEMRCRRAFLAGHHLLAFLHAGDLGHGAVGNADLDRDGRAEIVVGAGVGRQADVNMRGMRTVGGIEPLLRNRGFAEPAPAEG